MRYIILTAAFCLMAVSQVRAQSPATREKPPVEANETYTVPDMSEVKTLGLTQAQQVKVREIHAEFERERAALKDDTGTLDATVITRHKQRIKDVLTPGQYERYVALGAGGVAK